MAPQWLIVLSIVALAVAFISMFIIIGDILAGHHQKMAITNVVWPITALYFGPIALWAYWTMGRPMAREVMRGRKARGEMEMPERPFWQTVFVGVMHCGAGCTLGDIIAEWGVFILAFSVVGIALWPEFFFDYLLAYLLGIIFEYYAIVPMRGISGIKGIWAAIKADTLSLTAFELGLFAWMALYSLVFFHSNLHPDSPVYWFMMQIGMIVGFATSFPMNWWLIKMGIKEAM